MQIWCYGDSLRDHVICFVVADPANVDEFCKSHNLAKEGIESNPVFVQAVYDSLMKLAAEAKFNTLEKPK